MESPRTLKGAEAQAPLYTAFSAARVFGQGLDLEAISKAWASSPPRAIARGAASSLELFLQLEIPLGLSIIVL